MYLQTYLSVLLKKSPLKVVYSIINFLCFDSLNINILSDPFCCTKYSFTILFIIKKKIIIIMLIPYYLLFLKKCNINSYSTEDKLKFIVENTILISIKCIIKIKSHMIIIVIDFYI